MQIEQVLNYKFELNQIITLPLLETIDVFSHDLELQKISDQASSEAALELLLEKVTFQFQTLCHTIVLYCTMKTMTIKMQHYNTTFCLNLTYFSHNVLTNWDRVKTVQDAASLQQMHYIYK